MDRAFNLFLIPILIFAGCAHFTHFEAPCIAPTEDGRPRWWKAEFSINWEPDATPLWHIDLMIAHRIISSVLNSYEKEIILWRFHRRAVRDRSGHRFSFIFYTVPEIATNIIQSIRSDGCLTEMKNRGILIADDYGASGSDIDAMSDSGWSEAMRKAWPYYIMGASRMWLDLISETIESDGQAPSTCSESQANFEKAGRRVNRIWMEEGEHALLHHLNALFGYEPMGIRF